jgi:hypothetical protein
MRIDPDAVAHLAPEQLPYRHPERLALDVPQGLLDARDGGEADRSERPEAEARHGVDEMLDPHRILPDNERRQILDRAGDGTCLPFQRRLPPAVQTRLVGENLHENPVAMNRVDHDGTDAGDFHDGPSPPEICRPPWAQCCW